MSNIKKDMAVNQGRRDFIKKIGGGLAGFIMFNAISSPFQLAAEETRISGQSPFEDYLAMKKDFKNLTMKATQSVIFRAKTDVENPDFDELRFHGKVDSATGGCIAELFLEYKNRGTIASRITKKDRNSPAMYCNLEKSKDKWIAQKEAMPTKQDPFFEIYQYLFLTNIAENYRLSGKEKIAAINVEGKSESKDFMELLDRSGKSSFWISEDGKAVLTWIISKPENGKNEIFVEKYKKSKKQGYIPTEIKVRFFKNNKLDQEYKVVADYQFDQADFSLSFDQDSK